MFDLIKRKNMRTHCMCRASVALCFWKYVKWHVWSWILSHLSMLRSDMAKSELECEKSAGYHLICNLRHESQHNVSQWAALCNQRSAIAYIKETDMHSKWMKRREIEKNSKVNAKSLQKQSYKNWWNHCTCFNFIAICFVLNSVILSTDAILWWQILLLRFIQWSWWYGMPPTIKVEVL